MLIFYPIHLQCLALKHPSDICEEKKAGLRIACEIKVMDVTDEGRREKEGCMVCFSAFHLNDCVK